MTVPLRYYSAAAARDLPAMIIDSFAGGGGASTGIENALGRSPDVAINHSAAALALHAANHPETLHLDSNIWDVKPREVTRGRPVGLLWASPDCKHFSKAKGGAPRDRNIRDLAWVIVDWAEQVAPDVILMENVEEFVTWGPVDEQGQPVEWLRGQTFADWKRRLKRAGYKIDHRELRACDYGAPTIRKRFFLIARRDGRPIVWPKPTHGDPKSREVQRGKLLPWRTAAECIDWTVPCPSIFDTGAQIMAQHGLRAVRPLKANTLARIARGLHRYVLEAERPFLVNLTHGGRVEDLAQPINTITGAHRGEKALIDITVKSSGGFEYDTAARTQDNHYTGEDRTIGTCSHTIGASGGHTRGNDEAHAGRHIASEDCAPNGNGNRNSLLIAPSITRFNGGATGQDLRDPLATVTANSWIKKPGGAAPLGLIAPYLASIAHGYSGGRREYPLADPLGTVTVGGIQHAQIAPVLTYAQQGGGNRPMTAPHHTICASRKDQNSLIAATMVQTGYGEAPGQQPRALDLGRPLGTVVAGGAKHAPVAAWLAQQNNDSRRAGGVNPGRPADTPLSTICQTGSHQTLAAAFFAKYYGTGDGARTDDPCHTVTVKDRFAHVQAAIEAPPFGPEHEAKARAVAQLLRDHGLWDDRDFVTLSIGGAEFVIVDVGMRMLTPRELFRAQGFPEDYVIEGVWEGLDTDSPAFRPFAKDVQVSCCGNSVCPPLAEALVRANCEHLMAQEAAA